MQFVVEKIIIDLDRLNLFYTDRKRLNKEMVFVEKEHFYFILYSLMMHIDELRNYGVELGEPFITIKNRTKIVNAIKKKAINLVKECKLRSNNDSIF